MTKICALLALLLSLILVLRAQAEALYAATSARSGLGELYILDPANGSVITDVGALADAAGHSYGMTGLRYDPFNQVFYGATSPSSMTDPSYLVTVDPGTARVVPIGPLGYRITDIAYDITTQTMYAVSGSDDRFFTVDLKTGAAVAIGNTQIHPQEGGGLAASSTGALLGVTLFDLYRYNKTTGNASLVGPTGLTGYVRALAFSSNDTLYGVSGGTFTKFSPLRDLEILNPFTGLATIVGQTVGSLDALAFVPTSEDGFQRGR